MGLQIREQRKCRVIVCWEGVREGVGVRKEIGRTVSVRIPTRERVQLDTHDGICSKLLVNHFAGRTGLTVGRISTPLGTCASKITRANLGATRTFGMGHSIGALSLSTISRRRRSQSFRSLHSCHFPVGSEPRTQSHNHKCHTF